MSRWRSGRPTIALLATAAAVWLAACQAEKPLPLDDAACQRALDDPVSVEAQDWLRTSPGPNRLGRLSTDEGLALAHELERRGAGRAVVVAPREPVDEPGRAAAGLAVALPADPVRRRRVFDLYAKQVRAAGYAPKADEGQGCLFIAFE
jgi:hypothetical protein